MRLRVTEKYGISDTFRILFNKDIKQVAAIAGFSELQEPGRWDIRLGARLSIVL